MTDESNPFLDAWERRQASDRETSEARTDWDPELKRLADQAEDAEDLRWKQVEIWLELAAEFVTHNSHMVDEASRIPFERGKPKPDSALIGAVLLTKALQLHTEVIYNLLRDIKAELKRSADRG